jgi:hypothetical protein
MKPYYCLNVIGKLHFFLKFFLENKIFLDNFKFYVLIFSNFDCIFLENAISFFFALELDSKSLSTLQNFFLSVKRPGLKGM